MAKNVKYKKARPFLTFLVVLLVLCLLAMIFAFVWKLSDGFSDWSWFSTGEVEEVEEVDEDILPEEKEDSGDIVSSMGFDYGESYYVYSV